MSTNILSLGKKLAPQSRERMRQAVERCVEKFSLPTNTIKVTFRDMNGPKGGVDQECKIFVDLTQSGELVITSRAESIRAAFLDAANRLTTVLGKAASKRKTGKRG